jgi:glycine cleavage system H protein
MTHILCADHFIYIRGNKTHKAQQNPKDLRYTESHEWVKKEGDICTCGITDHAQEALTDIVFVELPQTGREVAQGDQVAVVESVKSVSDIYAPVSGKIIETNKALESSPEIINKEPYTGGWIFKIRNSKSEELDSLMDKAAYEKHAEEEAH